MNPPTPPACESNKQHPQPQPCILQIQSRGEFEGGDPYGTLTPTQRAPMAAEGCRGGPKAADRVGTLVLFLEEAPSETLLVHRLTPTPKGPKAVEGCPTLAPFSLKSH